MALSWAYPAPLREGIKGKAFGAPVHQLLLRASPLNLMNHPVPAGPNTTFGVAGSFGPIFSQADL